VGYEVETVDLAALERPLHKQHRRWRQIADLEIGQGLRIPESEFSLTAYDPTQTMRSVAWFYGKRLGRKYRTQRQLNGSMLIYRVK
jgi:hypothetical protein